MASSDGRYVVVFNGEIYNFLELRRELEERGHRFRTDSDTEVILAAYREWGEDCQFRMNGMWAFAIWDTDAKSLFLSRDRFGVKPLHFYWDGRVFGFASEMKAFLRMQGFQYSLDEGAMTLALADYTGLEATERCLFRGIRRLIGGHCLRLDADGAMTVRRWWRTIDHMPEVAGRPQVRVERFRELLIDATRLRLRSDVPLGTALSGGLDSSSVLGCSMEAARRQDVARRPESWRTAFIADFAGTVQDETRYALAMAEHAGANASLVKIDPREAIDHLDDILFSLEEVYDIPAALWLTYRAMRGQGIVVSLDGHGGDELLAGYHHYPAIAFSEALRRGQLGRARRLSAIHAALHAPGVALQKLSISDHAAAAARRIVRPAGQAAMCLARSALKRAGFRSRGGGGSPTPPSWLAVSPDERSMPVLEQDLPNLPQSDPVSRQLYIDFHATTLPTILRNFDRMSMAHGVEIRAPFMDYRVVTYGTALALDDKLSGSYTKAILRESMTGLVPDEIRLRRDKLGFVFPLIDWAGGHMRSYICDHLNSNAFRTGAVWNAKTIARDVETAFAQGDMAKVRHAWPFVQGSIIARCFSERASRA